MPTPRASTLCSVALMLFFISFSVPAQTARADSQQSPAAISDDTARGIKLYKQGATEEAIKLLKKVVKERRDDADAWYYLGLAYHREGRMGEALPAFEKVVGLRPESASAHAYLAYALLLANRTDAAPTALRAISLGENTAQLHYIIGEMFLREDKFERALEKANTSLEIDPGYASAIILKSLALLGLKRYQESAEALSTPLFKDSHGSSATWRGQLEELNRLANPAPANLTDGSSRIVAGREVTTKVRVLTKPEPSYTEEARKAGLEGTVTLSAVFSSEGTVTRILVLKWLPHGLTERAIQAARSLKFTPATKDGRPVSMFYRIEYNFNLY
ncbi:MAG: TonB family protein [Pyrinomonadaceae bacterium]